jgi:uncharacterized membrane protein
MNVQNHSIGSSVGGHSKSVHPIKFLFLSLGIQFLLAFFFGHLYDMRIFMATGHLAGTGQNPYFPHDLSAVFQSQLFQGITTIGYPPPWALVLGLIYLVVHPSGGNLLVYNLAIKIPIIAANIGLAYQVSAILKKLGMDDRLRYKAWIFMLFNPFVLYVSSAWGQFDSIVALLSLAALVYLSSDHPTASAVLLALAVSFKPTAFPIIVVVFLFFLRNQSISKMLVYFSALVIALLIFCVFPFILFGWDPVAILHGWNAHFTVGGGISVLSFLELINNSYQLPGLWWLVGLLWIPTLIGAAFVMRDRAADLTGLLKVSLALTLVFFLTRAWLSEPNILLVIPFILILVTIGELDRSILTLVWLVPLVFGVFNTSLVQLLFPSLPGAMEKLLQLADVNRSARLIARTITVVPWLAAGWWSVISCIQKDPARMAVGSARGR